MSKAHHQDEMGLSTVPCQRVNTPTILQIEITECGSVSLSIILAYYGLHISSERMRELCGISRDGSKAINIIKAARNLGMKAEGIIIHDLEKLRYLEPPFIIFWKFNHFLVVEGIKKNKVYINDPATGPRTMPLEEFDKDFTGIVLLITPGEGFKPGGKKEKSIFGLFRDFFKGDFAELSYIFFTSVLLTIPQASLALFIEFFIDKILVKQQLQWMPSYVASMLMVIMSIVALLLIQQFFIVRYKMFFSSKKVPLFFDKLLHLPMSFYLQRSTGDMTNRMHLFGLITEKITRAISETVICSLSIFIYSLIILLINPIIGLTTLFFTIISFSTVLLTKRKIIDLGRRYSQDRAKMQSIEYSAVQMIEELKFMGSENRFFSRWLSFKSRIMGSQQTIDFYTALISLLPTTLYFLNLVLLVIFSIHFVMQGTLSVGGMIAIYTLLLLFSDPVIRIVNNSLQVNELKGDLLRVNDVLLASTPTRKNEIKNNIASKNMLDINDVNFGYSRLEAPILSELNIKVKKGKSIALTGVSGGGKSSLLNLVCGLFEPWSGEIYLKGKNIKDYRPKELFNIISYVDQRIFLFEGTLRDNLTLWDDSIDDATIIEALKAACIHDVVNLKGGLQYHVQEGGSNLSLGQAQRIELARALIRKPELLLLDEATSALDSVTEARIYENLRKMDCSFIIVAHRLSAISHCDEIIVIENGGIIERGIHDELMQVGGRYREFILKDYLS